MDKDKQSNIGFFIGMVVGGAMGLAGVVLLSQKDGKKMAKDLWKRVEPLLDEWEEHVEDMEKNTHHQTAQILDTVETAKETVHTQVDETVKDATRQVVGAVDMIHEKLHEVTDIPFDDSSEDEKSTAKGNYFKQNGKTLG